MCALLAVEELGRGDPLVLIHGLATRRQIGNLVTPELARSRRIVTLDVPGFGDSAPVDDGFDLEGVAERIARGLAARRRLRPLSDLRWGRRLLLGFHAADGAEIAPALARQMLDASAGARRTATALATIPSIDLRPSRGTHRARFRGRRPRARRHARTRAVRRGGRLRRRTLRAGDRARAAGRVSRVSVCSSLSPLCAPHATPGLDRRIRLGLMALARCPGLCASLGNAVIPAIRRHPWLLSRVISAPAFSIRPRAVFAA